MANATFTDTDPRQLALGTATGDLKIANGRFVFTSGISAIAQDIVIRLRLFMGEWFLDLDAGTDWWAYLGEKYVGNGLHDEVSRVVLAAPGVQSIRRLSLTLDPATRAMAIGLTARTAFGDVDISTGVSNE